MYMLAQFREKRAYPLIAAFAALPDELPHDLAGDFVTEDLGRVLASVCGGDQSLIRGLIENAAVDEFVRSQACTLSSVWSFPGKPNGRRFSPISADCCERNSATTQAMFSTIWSCTPANCIRRKSSKIYAPPTNAE
jgi:hypothetical protein